MLLILEEFPNRLIAPGVQEFPISFYRITGIAPLVTPSYCV